MNGQYIVSVSINGYRLPYNPPDVQINYSDRQSNEFVTSGERTVMRGGENSSSGGGISAVRQTCSFTVLQWPKTPIYRSGTDQNQEYTNWLRSSIQESPDNTPDMLKDSWVESGDYIEMLRAAKEQQETVILEIVESVRSLVGQDSVPERQNGVLSHHRDVYLVDDVAINLSATSGFLRTAKVTFRKYTPPSRIFGTLSGDVVKGTLWMSFTDAAQPEAGRTEYVEYTDSCALEWIYNLLEDHADPDDNPRTTYPPNLLAEGYYLGVMYPIGAESHAGETNAPVSAGLAATETWGVQTVRYMKAAGNAVVYAAGKLDSALSTVEQGLTTIGSYVAPYISMGARIGLGIATGGWSELARVALSNHPWAGNLAGNIAQEYNRTQNYLSSIGNSIEYSILPPWIPNVAAAERAENRNEANDNPEPFKWGLGFDPAVHGEFFDSIPAPQAPFKQGTMIFERSPAERSGKRS